MGRKVYTKNGKMAAEEDVVRISYANLEQMVHSSQSGTPGSKRRDTDKSRQKSRRPAQQIYRPGQLRQGKEQKPGQRKSESGTSQQAEEEEDWDLKLNSTDEDKDKGSRESSGDINNDDIHQRLDDLYIDSPPREIDDKRGNGLSVSAGGVSEDTKVGDANAKRSNQDGDRKGGKEKSSAGKRRGKRPDLQIYVPKGRLGDREKRSEEKDSATPPLKGEGDAEPEFEEIVVSDSADSPRTVQVRNKGGAMKVTVMNDSLTSTSAGNSPSFSRKKTDTSYGKSTHQRQGQRGRESFSSDTSGRQQKPRDSDQRYRYQPKNEKPSKTSGQHEGKGKGNIESSHSDASGSQDVRKLYPQKSGKSYSKNRRSNSSDSRPRESDQDESKPGTFPRTKGGKTSKGGREAFSQNKNGSGKTSNREGEKFFWGMRRQRTGSISSEASVASNPSNGSFYSGSSDFTEDDEPEHILDWGEEVEKAHLEELARLVHDGAQKLTSSLDAYSGLGPEEPTSIGCDSKVPETPSTNQKKSVSADKNVQGKGKEGRPRRRNRHRKNSSQHGSRDSSVHSNLQGDDTHSERGHRRRRRRHNSQSSQGYEPQQHTQQPQHRQQQHYEERRYDEGGDSGRGNRSGLHVTIGQNNRHVEIRGDGRQRHRSDEKWDPHTVRDYDMEEGEDWGREKENCDERDFKRGDRFHGQQRREKDQPPRFRRESEGGPRGGGRGRRDGGNHGERDFDNYKHQGGRDGNEREKFRRGSFDSQTQYEERDDWKQGRDFDRRGYSGDQRAVHPAHDASVSDSRFGNRGRGRNQRQGQEFRRNNRGDDYSQAEQRHPGERSGSLNHDDLAISHKARGGGLLRLPTQQEPPRPSSTPSAAEHSYTQHHDAHQGSGGGANTRGPSHGKRHLFDPKNPSRPIVIPDSPTASPKFEETDKTPSPGAGPVAISPDSLPYPPNFYPPDFHPAYSFRHPMPPFPPQGPFMAGFPPGNMPPHVFYRFPGMPLPDMAPFYNSSDPDSEVISSAGSRSQSKGMAEQMLRDSHPFDSQVGNILSRRPHSDDSVRVLNQIRAELQNRLEQVILLDIEVANKHNVEQMLWKSVYYQVIESHRKRIGDEVHGVACKQRLIEVLEEGTRFFENLLKKLQSTYDFDLEIFTDGSRPPPENVNRNVKFALLSAQRVMMFLGDIARYKEQTSETTNYGKARHWYLKAQRIHPRNGRPYNQLAILAVYTRRKLDAVYYYMRSLAASNPILTARESLVSLFDEVRRKVDAVEKKRFEERRQRQTLRRRHQHRGPRVEIWVLPDGTSTEDRVEDGDDEEDLSSLSAIELNKRFVLTYLNVHGKLFTKINFEVFSESSSLMLQEFQTLIQHSPCVFSSTRLLQLMVINMFSIDNTALKDESLEECRSLLQEHAVEVGLDMFGLLVGRSSELLRNQIEAQNSGSKSQEAESKPDALQPMSESPTAATTKSRTTSVSSVDSCLALDEDLHLMLPALKTWVDWMMCHAHLWNPQPLNRPPDLGPQIDVWKNLATFCDLLNAVETKHGCLIREQKEGYEPVILHEDSTLAGFVPMLSAPQEVFYADSSVDKRQAEDWLRIEKLRLFGEYLCGVEPPMLAFNVESGKYYSVAPSPTRSEEKLAGEDKEGGGESGEESDDVIIEDDDSGSDETKDNKERDDIEKLKAKKAELSRRREEREKNKENMEAILDSHRHAKIELEIRPIFLIPDTNCFIDHFSTLKKLMATKKYTLVVPLIVINELDGLARGARDQQYDSPDHAKMVKVQARAAVECLEEEFEAKNPNLRAQTAKGSVLETIAFRSEESDGSGINDDIILNCCLHYCKDMAREFMPKDKDHPVRLYRDVVLLTDDRNLRLKAHTRNVPVKDVPSFKKWSKIT